MESNQTNPGTNIMEYFKRLINNWIIGLQAVLDPTRILDNLEEIKSKIQEVQTAITELEEKLEEMPRKIQEAETAITELKEKLKEMRILEETMEFETNMPEVQRDLATGTGNLLWNLETKDDDSKDEAK